MGCPAFAFWPSKPSQTYSALNTDDFRKSVIVAGIVCRIQNDRVIVVEQACIGRWWIELAVWIQTTGMKRMPLAFGLTC